MIEDDDGDDGSSSVLGVANYLMMNFGWAGQKKIGKIRQQRIPRFWG